MNKGVDVSKGSWLYFMGTDDCFLNKDVLGKLHQNFKNTSIDLLFGSVLYKIEKFHPFIYSKNKKEKNPEWNWKIWIYNTVHHQGTFFRRSVFDDYKYDLSYEVLSDYALNIKLYKRKLAYTIIEDTIALCSSSGVSKQGTWALYKEEIILKKEVSSIIKSPFFYILAMSKFMIRKMKYARR